MADAMRWLVRWGYDGTPLGFGGEVGTSKCETQDVPRFGALRRGNTPNPAECSMESTRATKSLLELFGRRREKGLGHRSASPARVCACSVEREGVTKGKRRSTMQRERVNRRERTLCMEASLGVL